VNNYHHLTGSNLLENVCSYVKVIWFVIYLCFWYQVINDLLDPTGQNLRVREDAQVSLFSFLKNFLLLIHDCLISYFLVSFECYLFRVPMSRV